MRAGSACGQVVLVIRARITTRIEDEDEDDYEFPRRGRPVRANRSSVLQRRVGALSS
jgi:hypothetical protein